MVGLIWWVAISDADDTTRVWVGLALVLGLLGDLFLLPAIDKFELGLGSFLLGHLAYVAAALTSGHSNTSWFVAGSVGALVAGLVIGWSFWQGLGHSRLRWPVMAYAAVTTALMIAVARTGLFFALIGAVSFGASDTLLGQTRFLGPRDDLRWIVHCLYHVGQTLLVIGLLNAV